MAVNSSPINPRAAAAPIVDQGKLTNQYINDRLGIDWHPATRPRIGHYAPDGNDGGGLTTEQIQQIVTGLGWQIHSADFMEQPSIDYDRYIYPLVESGCPAILAIMRPGVAHVVAVHGHTLNSDRWTPEARTGYGGLPLYPHTPTSAWSDHFVISDDNFGMYVTLPTEEIRNLLVPKYNPNLHAAHAIGLVPQGVETPGYFVEQKSAWFAGAFVSQATPGSGNRWFTELKRNEKQLVCRTLLVAKEPYLRDVTQWLDEGKLRVLAEAIPDSFWVTEITTPDLYQTNKTKLGDVIARIDAPISTNNLLDGLVFAWLPEIAVQVNGWKIYPDWPIDRHVPLFRREAAAFRVFEW